MLTLIFGIVIAVFIVKLLNPFQDLIKKMIAASILPLIALLIVASVTDNSAALSAVLVWWLYALIRAKSNYHEDETIIF